MLSTYKHHTDNKEVSLGLLMTQSLECSWRNSRDSATSDCDSESKMKGVCAETEKAVLVTLASCRVPLPSHYML